MIHNFVHACAGAGKTELIVQRCANTADQKRRLVITLTDSGQEELVSRLSVACRPSQMPDVMGWYAFMIRHYVRPYLPILFSNLRPTGFIFDRAMHPKNHFKVGGNRRYFSSNGSIYKETLPELAVKVAEAMQGAVEKRLGRIYDEIIIDEVQDISRKSLDIIERILNKSKPHLVLVGDVRQSLLDSDQTSSKNRNADRLELINWYRIHESTGRLETKELSETWRSNQGIADFSDRIFPLNWGSRQRYPKTRWSLDTTVSFSCMNNTSQPISKNISRCLCAVVKRLASTSLIWNSRTSEQPRGLPTIE